MTRTGSECHGAVVDERRCGHFAGGKALAQRRALKLEGHALRLGGIQHDLRDAAGVVVEELDLHNCGSALAVGGTVRELRELGAGGGKVERQHGEANDGKQEAADAAAATANGTPRLRRAVRPRCLPATLQA